MADSNEKTKQNKEINKEINKENSRNLLNRRKCSASTHLIRLRKTNNDFQTKITLVNEMDSFF